MQTEAPAIFDLSNEPQETLELYGIGKEPTDDYGRRCLLARRLVEKGVRFVCPVSGGGPGNLQWDAHDDIEENHLRMAAQTDQPIAALLKDLKRRGLLDSTLVLGAANSAARPNRRAARAATITTSASRCGWPAAASKAARCTARPTRSACGPSRSPYHFRDLHTTILHQLGLNQDALSYLHQGRKERLTEVHGTVIESIV